MPGVGNPNARRDDMNTAQQMNDISRPNIGNTYDGSGATVGGFVKTDAHHSYQYSGTAFGGEREVSAAERS